jgi:UDP-glucose 4-epimerase
MKILVTGGAGFIGSHVVDAYIKAGHKVVVIDNLITGVKANINKRAKFYRADITNRTAVERIMKKEKPDVINHHAALISVTDSVGKPSKVYEVNVEGTMNLLRAFGAYAKPQHLFIFASSAAVYGDPKMIPTPEATELCPISPYGISKALGESLVARAAEMFGFNYCIFRYSNAYGPRQNPKTGGVIAKVIGVMKQNKKPVMFGDGANTRDYIYVDDIVSANLLSLAHATTKRHILMNISSEKETTDSAIFNMIGRKYFAVTKDLHVLMPPVQKPIGKGNIRRSALANDHAKKTIGWKPTVDAETGVAKTVSSYLA